MDTPSRCGPTRLTNRPRSGAVTVEMAMTLPLMFLLVFASVEFGRMNMMRHTVDNAAYEAARKAIVPGATAQQAEDEARRMMDMMGARGVAVSVVPAVIEIDTQQVTVTVTVNAEQNGFVANTFFRGRQLSGTVTMNREHL